MGKEAIAVAFFAGEFAVVGFGVQAKLRRGRSRRRNLMRGR
ncbi:MAG: hypothetical protein ACJAZ9_001535 [Neolewinella sp.]|jgi:hypothetical protein